VTECAIEGCEKETGGNMYCGPAHKQKAYRERRNGVVEKAREITTLVDQSINEPFVILSPEGAERVARLASDIFTFPEDISLEDRERIQDPNERLFLLRWAKALWSFHNGEEIWRVVVGYDRETRFEEQYRNDKRFRDKVRRDARTYQNTRGMARLKVS
jgi:hypothetical protein